MHCAEFTALVADSSGWKSTWLWPKKGHDSDPDRCTMECGAIKVDLKGDHLSLEVPASTDPDEALTRNCKHRKWAAKGFYWNGSTFIRSTGSAGQHH